jgi:hypothetical protein
MDQDTEVGNIRIRILKKIAPVCKGPQHFEKNVRCVKTGSKKDQKMVKKIMTLSPEAAACVQY